MKKKADDSSKNRVGFFSDSWDRLLLYLLSIRSYKLEKLASSFLLRHFLYYLAFILLFSYDNVIIDFSNVL